MIRDRLPVRRWKRRIFNRRNKARLLDLTFAACLAIMVAGTITFAAGIAAFVDAHVGFYPAASVAGFFGAVIGYIGFRVLATVKN